MRHAGVGGTPFTLGLVGQNRYVRAQAAQAASNIWLGSIHLKPLRGSVKKPDRRRCSPKVTHEGHLRMTVPDDDCPYCGA